MYICIYLHDNIIDHYPTFTFTILPLIGKKTTRTRSIRKSRMGRLEQSWMGTLALESVAICMGISYTHQLFFLKGYLRVAMF